MAHLLAFRNVRNIPGPGPGCKPEQGFQRSRAEESRSQVIA
jgi:hypothetical protein